MASDAQMDAPQGWSELPELLLAEVVTKLPTEPSYVARLRLVCKPWSTVISRSTRSLVLKLDASKALPRRPISQWMPGIEYLFLTMHESALGRTFPSRVQGSRDGGVPQRQQGGPWPSWRLTMQPLLRDMTNLSHLTHLTIHEALLPKEMCQLSSEVLWPCCLHSSKPQIICCIPDDLSRLSHLQQLTVTASAVAHMELLPGILDKWSGTHGGWQEAVRAQLAELVPGSEFRISSPISMHGLVLPSSLSSLTNLASLRVTGTHCKFASPPGPPLSLTQLQLLGGVRMASLAAAAPSLRHLRDLSLDVSDLWYVTELPLALANLTGLTALHLQWLEKNEQGLQQVRDLFTQDGSMPFDEGMQNWSSSMCSAFAHMSALQHFSFNLVWPKGGLNRLQPTGDLFWGELVRTMSTWLGAMDHSLSSMAFEGQAGLALTLPSWVGPHTGLKSLIIGDCHWPLLQLVKACTQLTELVLLVEGEASGGTHISHQWTMPHLLRADSNTMAALANLGRHPRRHSRSGGAHGRQAPQPLLQHVIESLRRFVCVLDDKRVALELALLGIWGCYQLESLVLCLPDARALPEELGHLVHLTELVVRLPDSKQQRSLQLPRSISQLVDLQTLDLSWSGLEHLGPELWDLTSLTALLIGNNQLSFLPPPPGSSRAGHAAAHDDEAGPSSSSSSSSRVAAGRSLPWLRKLSLVNNCITQLPPVFFAHMPCLQHLNLACNSLRQLPQDLRACRQLVTLLVAGNELQQLPLGLGALHQLEVLDLTLNHFQSLPEDLGQLTALTQLQLSWNHLLAVPEWVGQLKELKVIELGFQHMPGTSGKHRLLLYSDLQDLPQGLTALRQLSHLHLDLSEYMHSPVLEALQQERGSGVVTGTHRMASMAPLRGGGHAQANLRGAARTFLLRWLIQTGTMWQAGVSEGALGAHVQGGCSASCSGGGVSSSSSSGGAASCSQSLARWMENRWCDAAWLVAHRSLGGEGLGGYPHDMMGGVDALMAYEYEMAMAQEEESEAGEDEVDWNPQPYAWGGLAHALW